MLVENPQELARLSEELRAAGSFALDTEFIRENSYRPRLCLLQVAYTGGLVLVDPLAVGDLGSFLSLVLDPSVEKILHSGEQDMEIFFALGRKPPRNIFDTQVAGALVGRGECISYARLVENLCGVRLSKAETYTDWSRRPLSPRQLEYALDDVRYLLPMAAKLAEELRETGRSEWLREELAFYETPGAYSKDRRELFRHVRSSGKLDARDLAVLREIAAWREEEAETVDRPRGRVLEDESLVEIARRAPRTLDALSKIRGVHPRLVQRGGEELIRRIAVARSLPASEWPRVIERAGEDDAVQLVADLLWVAVGVASDAKRIASGYLTSRKELLEWVRAMARAAKGGTAPATEGEAAPPFLRGWRREIIGSYLLSVLRGEARLAVDSKAFRVALDRLGTGAQ